MAILVLAGLTLAIVSSQLRSAPPHVSGILETDEIRLGSRVGDRVHAVWAEEGEQVIADQPLVEFEPYDLIEKEQQAIAELALWTIRAANRNSQSDSLQPQP